MEQRRDDVREAPAVYGLQSADSARDTLKALVKDAITTLLNNELIELGCGSASLPRATHSGHSHAPSGTASTSGSQQRWW